MLRREDVSRTARLVAACRALDADRPATERIIRRADTYARDLAGPEAFTAAAAYPPLPAAIALRTRWLDDQIEAFARRHPDGQVVILGAGLDTRALRLELPIRFFEVDLPGMLELKDSLLGTDRRISLPVDLRDQPFTTALRAHPRFDARAPTCVVWEGVTYYLPEAAIHATLDQVAAILSPEGLLLFDYVTSNWLAAVQRAGSAVVDQVAAWREPLIFGFADLRGTLAAHGLTLVADDATTEERWYAARMAAARKR